MKKEFKEGITIIGIDNQGGKTKVNVPYSPDVTELLGLFERFMRAYGYCINGLHLEIVEDEPTPERNYE